MNENGVFHNVHDYFYHLIRKQYEIDIKSYQLLYSIKALLSKVYQLVSFTL